MEQDWDNEMLKIRLGTRWHDGQISHTPTLSTLCAKFRTAKPKAVAEDLLGAELGKVAPEAMARRYHPLVTKSFETSWLSSFFRGGHLF